MLTAINWQLKDMKVNIYGNKTFLKPNKNFSTFQHAQDIQQIVSESHAADKK